VKTNEQEAFAGMLVDIHAGVKRAQLFIELMEKEVGSKRDSQLVILKGMLENVQWDVTKIMELV